MMLRVLFLTLCYAFVMSFPDHPPMGHKGPPFLIKIENCCVKDLMQHDDADKDMLKECFQKSMKPHTCERDICVATKKGYASSDGTIDKKALQEVLEKDFKDNTLEAILENCVNGDLSKFGKEDFCELRKLKMCIDLQVVKSCDDWKDNEDCKKLKSWIESHIKKFE